MNSDLLFGPVDVARPFSIYYPVIITLVCAALIFVVNLIIRNLKKNINTEIKDINRITKASDIAHLTKIYNFTEAESFFLRNLCKTQNIPNLEYIFRSEQESETFFENHYTELKERETEDDDALQYKLSQLFSIRQKVENARKTFSNLTSTTSLPVNQRIFYVADNKEQFECKIIDNIKEGLVLTIPKDLFGHEIRLPELTKVSVIYQTKSGVAYLANVRIIRYQDSPSGSMMVVTHCNNMQSYQRRQSRRVGVNTNCTFSAVKVVTNNSQNGKLSKISYEPLANQYHGHISEISAGGCSLQTNLSIRENQYIYIRMKIDGKTEDNIVGMIVSNTPSPDNSMFILHILFVKLSRKTRNKIYSLFYEYRN